MRFKLFLSALLVSVIILGSASSCKGQIAKIAVEGPTTAGVCQEFTVDIWIRDLPASMIECGIRVEWDQNMMEYVRHTNHVTENGWNLLGDTLGTAFYSFYATGSPFSQDASWVSITFHCLGPGTSEIKIEESYIEGQTAGISYNAIDLEVNQVATVGGISTPIKRLEILAPYITLVGLIIAVSTIYVIKKRKE